MKIEFEQYLTQLACEFDPALDQVLLESMLVPHPLREAMHVAVMGGGKRFRPFLVASCAALFEIPSAGVQRVGAAVEFLHAASLILDDLPAMDNAELRRGQPALHRRFGEAHAILTATALIALAFETLADPKTNPDAELRAQLVAALAHAVGAAGITGGQALDLAGDEGVPHKTAHLTRFCCEAGAILGGATPAGRELLQNFGTALGRAFQYRDDCLDHDLKNATLNVIPQEARSLAMRLETEQGFPSEKVAPLIALADWCLARAQ